MVLIARPARVVADDNSSSSPKQDAKSEASPTPAPTTPGPAEVAKMCQQNVEISNDLGSLLNQLKALNPPPPTPSVPEPGPATPVPQASSTLPAAVPADWQKKVLVQQVLANEGVMLQSLRGANERANEELQAAATARTPEQRQTHLEKAHEQADESAGLITQLTYQLAQSAPHPPPMPRISFGDMPDRELLIKMAPSGGNPPVLSVEQSYDGNAARVYQEVNQGIGTHFYSIPSPTGPPVPSSGLQSSVSAGSGAPTQHHGIGYEVPPPPIPQKEPGGIKFCGARAEELANTLDVTSIAFDPVRGRIVLAGPKQGSAQSFDLDVFSDVLLLAEQEYEPFFSLDPSEPADWDGSLSRITEAMDKKYSTMEIAQKVRALCPAPVTRGSRTYYYTTIEAFDPDLVKEANRGHDITTTVVYSPGWLRYSKVGQILFEADMAIKSVASGFFDRAGSIEPAFVWQDDDFNPIWLNRDVSSSAAGRANFELSHTKINESDARIDLAEVHPGLYVTQRKNGTSQDLPPSTNDVAISKYFDSHWHEFVEHVPEIARLEMVFRAYVAARFLIAHHPGLAARIRAMPRFFPPEQPPLRIIHPTVIRVAFENGRPIPVVPDTDIMFDFSIGYGGGVKFGLEAEGSEPSRVEVANVPVDPNDWFHGLLAAASYGDAGYVESGDRGAAAIEFDSDGLPAVWHLRIASMALVLVLIAGAATLIKRRFDWQQLAAMKTCRHCAGVHGKMGRIALAASAMTASAMMYLCILPLLAAYDTPWSLPQLCFALSILVAVLLTFILIGTVIQSLGGLISKGGPRNSGWAAAMFTGAHITCLFFAVFLLHRGLNGGAIGSNLAEVLTPTVTERIFVKLNGIGPIAIALGIGLAGTILTVLLRWAVPYALGSRPLALYSPHETHTHSPAPS
jgi:hypothetical protein